MNTLRIVVLVILFLIIAFSTSISIFYTDLLWFQDLGLNAVFWFRVWFKAILFLASFLVAFAVIEGNLWPAFRQGSMAVVIPMGRMQDFWLRYRETFRRYFTALFSAAAALFALVQAGKIVSNWETVALYLNRQTTGKVVPVFGLDTGFFLFSLPFYSLVADWLFSLLIVTIALVSVAYFLRSVAGTLQSFRVTFAWFKEHFYGLLAALSLVEAARLYLGSYYTAYSPRGAVFGPAYADVHATIPGFRLAAAAFALLGVFFVYSAFASVSWRQPLTAFGLALAVTVGAAYIYPSIIQAYVVAPSELTRERPYIEHHIAMTRAAYDLERFNEIPHEPPGPVTAKALDENRATLESVRLWDWRPLLSTYQQLQAIRTYYVFSDIDLDRYPIGGRPRQLAVAVRELSSDNIPERARTWINVHLKYTHGYGLVANPVNEVAQEGLPVFFARNIPVEASYPALAVKRPQIYFGELTNEYAIVGTKEKEFDYPSGDRNIYTRFAGKSGVQLSSYLRKLAFAIRFGTLKILLSSEITPESRVLFDRQIVRRAEKIAPFLTYDRDPYPVALDGSIVWVLDAYTTSNRFPYAQPYGDGSFNYLRNSVKVVIDAYTGETTFYVWDDTDPILAAYRRVFPSIFKDRATMPEGIVSHLRYPEDLFRVQATMLTTYHMRDPDVFYNREDQWDIAREIFDTSTVDVDPYYVIMQLPERSGAPFRFEKPEFLTMLPFTPRGKSNMISWLFVSSDPPHYGMGGYFVFGKGKLVYGPLQIESRIDQDPVISQQITLWNQAGSRVIRGNLLVIPLDGSLLYVEPLYLQSEQSQIPELKRVIVASEDRVQMAESLDSALAALVGRSGTETTQEAQQPGGATGGADIARLRELFSAMEESLKRGDYARFGASLEELKRALFPPATTQTTTAGAGR